MCRTCCTNCGLVIILRMPGLVSSIWRIMGFDAAICNTEIEKSRLDMM